MAKNFEQAEAYPDRSTRRTEDSVEGLIERCRVATHESIKHLGELNQLLEPVLNLPDPSPSSDSDVASPVVSFPLAETLHSHLSDLQLVNERLRDFSNRLRIR